MSDAIGSTARSMARRCTQPGWPCPHAAPPELEAGTIVGAGRFVVVGLLGRGGMATVYRGHDRTLGREVALKVMLEGAAELRARVRRFEHEAALVGRLPAHPSLLRLLHAGRLPELAGRPFLATERVEGPTLAFRLATTLRMPSRQAVRLGLGVARGLAAAHGVGVVHRDLTARNIVLGRAGEARAEPLDDGDDDETRPVIVDFGLAARVEPEPRAARLTQLHQRPGTVTAMAPEQYRGAPAHPAMDVYALGRLLYQMLTGEDPHATVPLDRLLACHRDGARVAPRLVGWATVEPRALAALVDACTEPGPSRRPTADAVGDELRSIARALARGATVVPLRGVAACSSEVLVVASPRPRGGVGPTRGRSRSRRRRRTRTRTRTRRIGRWLGSALAVASVAVGAVGGVVGWRGEAEPIEARAVANDREVERVAVAWPSTVVPLVEADHPRAPSSSGRAEARPTPSSSLRAVHGSPRASVKTMPSEDAAGGAACEEQRERAQVAARRWAWPEVLEATADPACWPEPSVRVRLRLVAWIEQQRFDACVDEGAHVRDPALVRLVERCRARHEPGATDDSRDVYGMRDMRSMHEVDDRGASP